MTKRNIDIQQNCIICSSAAAQACVNCHVAHCPQHLLGRSCAGCSGQLWLLQAKYVRWLGFVYALFAIPIVALSANALVGDRKKCLLAGMDEHVPKPIVPAVLFMRISQWLPKKDEGQSKSA